jgi:hypothetical protein
MNDASKVIYAYIHIYKHNIAFLSLHRTCPGDCLILLHVWIENA